KKHKPRMYYAGGVGLLGKFDADLAMVLREAKRLGALTFVDVVFPYRKSWAFMRKAWRWTDVLHCNADEAASITGQHDPLRAAAAIRRLGAGSVFVTMGGEGLVASVPGAVIRMPSFAVRVTDPTGAGDAFSAGLIFKIHEALEKGRSLEEISADEWSVILVYASACGAVCTTGIGTTTAVDKTKVEALVRRHGGALARSSRIQAARNSSRASRKARTLAGSQS
ncbi:MAG: PfkB family carbohydrate kinase, partial [Candidatus Aminicenantes bacterium]